MASVAELEKKLAAAKAAAAADLEKKTERYTKRLERAHAELSLAEADFERAQGRLDKAESTIDSIIEEAQAKGINLVQEESESEDDGKANSSKATKEK